ncbi:MAG: ATP-binding protein [Candidatus Abyssobacteria bacterium SURF_5]|uniref:Iron-sulfur cluster carrier protein n=1 Tax=Abyssobacteria bacterium (strain SURF_5) TaxID=2093360 RepID=A0A3A4P9X5_ABYX5|nr:MAG: ATP-binding protein [Candidatus Abyssubacteria bacterium SURF_5]
MDQKKKPCESCPVSECPARQKSEAETDEAFRERQALYENLCRIKHKILVLSGKGGVGKSTVAANLAVALAESGKQVGLLDIDVHGPSIPKLLGLEEHRPRIVNERIMPAVIDNLKVMSLGFFMPLRDEAVIWRGPMKMSVIRQFLRDVEWGDLDYLLIDSPPGTGDEPLSAAQLIEDITGAIIVTTPQEVAIDDVRKSITFCRQLHVPVIGVIENMSGFVCPDCGSRHDIFKSGGGEDMAAEMLAPFLGRIPIDPSVVTAADEGKPAVGAAARSPAARAFADIIKPLLHLDAMKKPA